MVDIKLVEYLKKLGWSLNYLKSFQCDWKVIGGNPGCYDMVESPYRNGSKIIQAKELRGGICNSCWARGFAEQELPEVEKMLKQLGVEVPDWNEIPNKG